MASYNHDCNVARRSNSFSLLRVSSTGDRILKNAPQRPVEGDLQSKTNPGDPSRSFPNDLNRYRSRTNDIPPTTFTNAVELRSLNLTFGTRINFRRLHSKCSKTQTERLLIFPDTLEIPQNNLNSEYPFEKGDCMTMNLPLCRAVGW